MALFFARGIAHLLDWTKVIGFFGNSSRCPQKRLAEVLEFDWRPDYCFVVCDWAGRIVVAQSE